MVQVFLLACVLYAHIYKGVNKNLYLNVSLSGNNVVRGATGRARIHGLGLSVKCVAPLFGDLSLYKV